MSYAKNWQKNKLRNMSRQKRGVPLKLDIQVLEDNDSNRWLVSKDYTPEELDYQQRMVEDMRDFLSKHKFGYIFYRD